MPWTTPTLRDVRAAVRDFIRGTLPGADASIANSVLRVMSDVMGAVCHLTLQYIDWLALQLLPDTAEHDWLDRHGDIWLVNADGTTGRKLATLASGTAELTGVGGTIAPQAMQIGIAATGYTYETLAQVTIDANQPTPVPVRALETGSLGNAVEGAPMQVINPPAGIDANATAVLLTGGTDMETDDELRARVLQRIRNPPMGGSAADYVRWALAVPGVTRAWCDGNEQGIGTVAVRFMMDDLRASNQGFPLPQDVAAVDAYIETVRPVTVKECFVLGPLPFPINFAISNLNPNTTATQAAIVTSINAMLFQMAAPGQTIYAAWKSAAIMNAPGVISFDMTTLEDDVMPAPGYMACLGDIYWEGGPTPTTAKIASNNPPLLPYRK